MTKKKLNKKKLAKILGMMGSNQQGERDNAIEQAMAMLQNAGADWYSLLGIDDATASDDEQAEWTDVDANIAEEIINSEDVLSAFIEVWRKVMAGEENNAKLLYLAATSRLLDKCIHTAIKGPSSAGKSEIRKKVLAFIPDEDVVSFTSLSEKALYYWPDDFPHKILSMGEANGAEEQGFQDYLLRELMSEGILRYARPMTQVGFGLATQTLTKHGPVAFMVTTTKAALHAENETRMLSLEVDDSAQQTASVMKKIAANIGMNAEKREVDYEPWQSFQRWLASGNCKVVVPYAATLSPMIPPKAVRLRRDFTQVLLAVKAHALLHRNHRKVDERNQIVADIERDYRAIYGIMANILAEASGASINAELQQTINAVKVETVNLLKDDGATAYSVGKRLKLDKSAAWRRLRVAAEAGFIANLETRRGQPGRWRVIPEQEIVEESLLPSPEALAAVYHSPLRATGATAQSAEKSEQAQDDSGCPSGCSAFATGSDNPIDNREGEPVASATQPDTQPDKPLNGKVKSEPVVGLHGLHGLSDPELAEPVSFESDPLDIPPELYSRRKPRPCQACDGNHGRGCPTCTPENYSRSN
jgi:hypothetical protein